jgi:aminoacyl tRNA synthase complex-interacting multifunctional protein 2
MQVPYDAGNVEQVIEVDSMLDLHSTLRNGNNKERAAVLRTLNSKLGKNEWLVGSSVSLADIVLWSGIVANSLDAPGNVKKWLDRCSSLDAFKFALQAM